ALKRPFGPGDLSTVQSAGDHHLDALGTEANRLFHRLLHRTAKSYTLLKLLCDLFRLKLCVQFRMADLLNGNHHLAARLSLHILFQLFDLGTLAADDDTGPRGINDDLKPGRCTFDIDVRNASAGKFPLEIALEPEVLGQE